MLHLSPSSSSYSHLLLFTPLLFTPLPSPLIPFLFPPSPIHTPPIHTSPLSPHPLPIHTFSHVAQVGFQVKRAADLGLSAADCDLLSKFAQTTMEKPGLPNIHEPEGQHTISIGHVALTPDQDTLEKLKKLKTQYAAAVVWPSVAEAQALGRLFNSCGNTAGGGHATLCGGSFNESTLLGMTTETTPQTVHVDDNIPSLAVCYNASPFPVMGPEFLKCPPVNLAGPGVNPSTPAGQSSRQALISMWTALEKNTNPDMVSSGVLQPGDAVFFDVVHPHRGPSTPFPPRTGPPVEGPSQRALGKRAVCAPIRFSPELPSAATLQRRTMIFISAVHTKGTSEKHAIFAHAPPPPRRGRVWHERSAFNISKEERTSH